MIRKFILPVIAAGLLAGCVTPGYNYRGGSGDYYYGGSVRSVPYGYGSIGYGSRGGWYGNVGYGARIGYGYPYGYYGYYPGYLPPYGGYRPPIYYPHYPYRPPVYPRPGDGNNDPRPPKRRAPWRDIGGYTQQPQIGNERISRPYGNAGSDRPMPSRPAVQQPRPSAPPAASPPRGAIRSVYSPQRQPARPNESRSPRSIEP